MRPEDVLYVLDILEAAGIEVWVHGGWGVDALLGEQTRAHNDLDIAIRTEDLDPYRRTMLDHGFRIMRVDNDFNFVVIDDRDREVDVHGLDLGATRFNEIGVEVYGPNGLAYEVGSLDASGIILGRRVACTTADFQIRSHTSYKLNANDYHDVFALHERFGLPLPEPYRTLAAKCGRQS